MRLPPANEGRRKRRFTERTEFTNGGTELTEDEARRVRRPACAAGRRVASRRRRTAVNRTPHKRDDISYGLLRSSSVESVAPFVNSVTSVLLRCHSSRSAPHRIDTRGAIGIMDSTLSAKNAAGDPLRLRLCEVPADHCRRRDARSDNRRGDDLSVDENRNRPADMVFSRAEHLRGACCVERDRDVERRIRIAL